MIWFPLSLRAAATPLSTQLSLSEPQPVKNISAGSALRAFATCSLALSIAFLLSLAILYTLDMETVTK